MTEGSSWNVTKPGALFIITLLVVLPFSVIDMSDSDANMASGVQEMHPEPTILEADLITGLENIKGEFIANRGQVDNPEVMYYARGDPLSIGLTKDGAIFNLMAEVANQPMNGLNIDENGRGVTSFRLRFDGCNPVTPVGLERCGTAHNFYVGARSDGWYVGVDSYTEVRYKGIYDGIDLRFHFFDGLFKYDLEVGAGADPSMIKMVYDGVEGLSLDRTTGDLVIETRVGTVRDHAPVIITGDDGNPTTVDAEFRLVGENQVTFDVPDELDGHTAYVIDPGLQYSTYLGGTNYDYNGDVALDDDGNVYISGMTYSTDFNTTHGPNLTHEVDLFVAKFDPTVSTLLNSTLFGGKEGANGWEVTGGIDVSADAVYISGYASASDYPMPDPGVISTSQSGMDDCIIAKFDLDLTLIASTYIGSDESERCKGIQIDNDGYVYIAGATQSNDFPTTPGAYCSTRDASRTDLDNFIMKISGDLHQVIHSTFIGGDGREDPVWNDFEVIPDGTIYFCSRTDSVNFNTTDNAYSRVYAGGNSDGVVCKLTNDLSTLIDSTYFGCPGDDYLNSIEVGSDSKVYVGGDTDNGSLPLSNNAFDRTQSAFEGVLVIFDANLTSLTFSSYLGGTNDEAVMSILLSADETVVYLCGWTRSTDMGYTNGSFYYWLFGGYDTFLAGINLTSLEVDYLTSLGGSYYDHPYYSGIEETSEGYVVIYGRTMCTDFPTTSNAYQTIKSGSFRPYDIFVSILDPRPVPPPPAPELEAVAGNGNVSLRWELDIEWSIVTWFRLFRGTDPTNITNLVAQTMDMEHTDEEDILNGDIYYYQVIARNSAGWSNRSEIVNARPRGSPSVMGPLNATSGDGTIHLNWSPPFSTGGIELRGYRIYRSLTPRDDDFEQRIDLPNQTYWRDEAVDVGVIYYYKIMAYNPSYEGGLSKAIQIKATDTPSPPQMLSGNGTDGLITLDWLAPSFTGGSPLIGFRISRGLSEDAMVMIDVTLPTIQHYEDDAVINGVPYVYGVSSFSPVGESAMSNLIWVTPVGPPTPPVNLDVENGNGEVKLTWDHPAFGVGTPDLRFHVFLGPSETELTKAFTISDSTEWKHTDLVNGEHWYYMVQAETDMGISLPSEVVMGVPSWFPGTVGDLQAIPGDGEVRLSWSSPSSTGGTPLTLYHIHKGEAVGPLELIGTVNASDMTFIDDTVENGMTYRYAVSAESAFGIGDLCDPIEATPTGMSSIPVNFDADPGEENVILTWNPPVSDGGTPIVGYVVYRGVVEDVLSVLVEETVDVLYIDHNVDAGITYYYAVAAVTAIGEGEMTRVVQVDVVGRPGKPAALKAKVESGDVILSWEDPTSDGGSPLTGYYVLRGSNKDSLSIIKVLGLVNTFTDKTAEDGRTYWYSVQAVNAIGDGEQAIAEDAEMPPSGTPLWLLALIVILVVLAIIVVAMLLRGPREVVVAEDEDAPDETYRRDE